MSRFASFREFYPAYLAEHSERSTRRLHFLGTLLVIVVVAVAIGTGNLRWLLLAPVLGYGLAWIGHFVFEKNQPASFKQPLYSFMGDWKMFWQILTGRIAF